MRQNIARSRFDAISDGVFAIAMTIMVLEIKTPKLGDSSADAIEHYLKTTLPTLMTFAVSFILLAAKWRWQTFISCSLSVLSHFLQLC